VKNKNTTHLITKFVFFIFLAGLGCVNPKTDVTSSKISTNSVSSADTVKKKILEYYDTGKTYEDIGYVKEARLCYNKAVLLAYNQSDLSPDFKKFRDDIVTKIYLREVSLNEKEYESSFDEDNNDIKNEILEDGQVFLSREEEEEERKLIESTNVEYSFPVVVNDKVLAFVKSYTTKLKPGIKASLERSGMYIDRFKQIFREEGVPEDLAYLPIIESGFKIHALSRAKAKGLWQFIRSTARLEGLKVDWWVDERCEPDKSARAAAKHLKKLYEHFGDWYLALAAYNAGQGKIDRAIKKAKTKDFWKIAGKRRLLRTETKNYVPAFIAALIIAKNPQKYGFTELNFKKPLEYDSVEIDSCTDLRVVAKLCGTSVGEIRKLNPHLRRLATPVKVKNFKLNIPKGKKDNFLAKFNKLPPSKRVIFRYHRIKKGETLSQIARKYSTSVSAICRANKIRNKRLIRAGKTIVIPVGWRNAYYVPQSGDYTLKQKSSYYRRGKKIVYRVRRGDSLFKIARKFGTNVKSIKKWNNLKTKLLKPGQKLIVYYGIKAGKNQKIKSVKKGRIPKGYYRVKRGDTIYSISRKFGLSVAELKKINRIRSNLIKPGDLLKVRNI